MIFSFACNETNKPQLKDNTQEISSISEPKAQKLFKADDATSTSNLYIDDYYSNYYFFKSKENYGRNEKGSCTQLAFAQLLACLDTYWDDSYIPENYELHSTLSSNELDYDKSAPGIQREPNELVNDLSTSQYWNVVLDNSDKYFHLLLIKIGYEQFGYYNFSEPENPCALTGENIQKLANYYIYDYLGKSTSEIIIKTNEDARKSAREFTIECIKNGIPVELRGQTIFGGHAMIAYDYDETNDEIYVHAGWGADKIHVPLSSLGFSSYWDAMALIPPIRT